jgi:putative tryptophan/tyrosine transport system substrate-binding protein
LQQATHTVPIVFVLVIDPVGGGLVANLARPGGNTTGFTVFEYGMSGKWVELLKEIAPGVRRVAVLRDLAIGIAQLAAMSRLLRCGARFRRPAAGRGFLRSRANHP